MTNFFYLSNLNFHFTGFSGADCMALMNEASFIAAKLDKDFIDDNILSEV